MPLTLASPGKDAPFHHACGLDFRHGPAVLGLRSGVPLTDARSDLGNARVDTTNVSEMLSNRDRRCVANRIDLRPIRGSTTRQGKTGHPGCHSDPVPSPQFLPTRHQREMPLDPPRCRRVSALALVNPRACPTCISCRGHPASRVTRSACCPSGSPSRQWPRCPTRRAHCP